MKNSSKDLLKQPIESLPLSEEFQAMACANHFKNLASMTELPIEILGKMEQFNHRMMAEYVSYMEGNGLGDMIDD